MTKIYYLEQAYHKIKEYNTAMYTYLKSLKLKKLWLCKLIPPLLQDENNNNIDSLLGITKFKDDIIVLNILGDIAKILQVIV